MPDQNLVDACAALAGKMQAEVVAIEANRRITGQEKLRLTARSYVKAKTGGDKLVADYSSRPATELNQLVAQCFGVRGADPLDSRDARRQAAALTDTALRRELVKAVAVEDLSFARALAHEGFDRGLLDVLDQYKAVYPSQAEPIARVLELRAEVDELRSLGGVADLHGYGTYIAPPASLQGLDPYRIAQLAADTVPDVVEMATGPVTSSMTERKATW